MLLKLRIGLKKLLSGILTLEPHFIAGMGNLLRILSDKSHQPRPDFYLDFEGTMCFLLCCFVETENLDKASPSDKPFSIVCFCLFIYLFPFLFFHFFR